MWSCCVKVSVNRYNYILFNKFFRQALEKMTKGSSSISTSQIKCPTCPNTQTSKEALELKIF